LVFYAGATAFILMVWQIQKNMTANVFEPVLTQLNSVQLKQLDAFMQMNQLVTTLGTALLGALGFLLVNGRNARGSAAMLTAFLSAACVGLSLFFGYVVYLGIVAMLQYPYFNLEKSQILWARQAHFYTFLLGVVLFGDFAFHSLHKEDGHDRSNDAAGH
jgi:hypothetical protein